MVLSLGFKKQFFFIYPLIYFFNNQFPEIILHSGNVNHSPTIENLIYPLLKWICQVLEYKLANVWREVSSRMYYKQGLEE